MRPKRWNAVIEAYEAIGEGRDAPGVFIPKGVGPLPPVMTLVSGQVDVEPWADEQEVTLDRTIGSIDIFFRSFFDSSDEVTPAAPVLKLGLLVNEEVTQDAAGSTIDLWEQEQMEDYEWMWMHTCIPELVQSRFMSGTSYANIWQWRIEMDIRNRRKIGQSDELNLFASYLNDGPSSLGEPVITAHVNVRTILMSK